MRTGKCDQGESCKCVGTTAAESLRVLCPNYSVDEQPVGDLESKSINNWNTIPEASRKACVAHLRNVVPAKVVDHWSDQAKRGMRIGSDDIRFHFGVGMFVRNTLRFILRDEQLPAVMYGKMEMRNWDDFYYGALDALTRELA